MRNLCITLIAASHNETGRYRRFLPINEMLIYNHALERCRDFGGELAMITSDEENRIVQYLTDSAYCENGLELLCSSEKMFI